ncbi:MAG: hypothetical protein K6G40_09240 [Eubacterium sp.]|nr:hypothetical protein [Eubacterium sp.]
MEGSMIFNADVRVVFHGVEADLSDAKGKLRHASSVAMEYDRGLPRAQKAEFTDRDGFIHLTSMTGDVKSAELTYIITESNEALFERKKSIMTSLAEFTNLKFGTGSCEIFISE